MPCHIWQRWRISYPSCSGGWNRRTPLSVENAGTQLLDCLAMIDRPRHIDSAPEREAEAIVCASEQEVRDYVRRGIMERWLSHLVHTLNLLEGRPATRDVARRALRRLGFPTSELLS